VDSLRWRRFWDWCFGLGSLVPALLLGVALGNVLRGLPVTAAGQMRTGLWPLLNPYALLTGLLGLALFVMHGAAWLRLKTADELQARMGRWLTGAWMAVVVLLLAVAASSFFAAPGLFAGLLERPAFWLLLVLLLAAVVALPPLARAGRHRAAFLASAATVLAPFGLAATGLFPRLVPSSIDPAYDLTIYNAASTPRTLTAMLVIALIGMPLVIVYHVHVYRTFAGKVRLADDGY
jgi:cytochrome d ubiquinol oxidase subunit II